MVERSARTGGIGTPVQRKEDGRLLTGKGYYVTDVWLPKTLYAWMVRSPHAHARIRKIDISAALQSPGVIAVLTGQDMIDDGLHLMDHKPSLVGPPDRIRERYRAWADCGITGLTISTEHTQALELMADLAR